MKAEFTKISIIIVAYININIVRECLKSIQKFNDIGDSLEVIVIDNSPINQRVDLKLKEEFPNVKFLKNKNNGFGGGNNVGARIAKGRYLFFLNPDTLLVEPLLSFAFTTLENNPSIGILGFQLLSQYGTKNMSFYLIDSTGFLASLIIKICNKFGIFINRYMYISGANMFVRRKYFMDCGMFDENIFLYYEEPDLTKRLHKLGKVSKFCRNKKIIHIEGGSSEGAIPALRRELDSARYYYNKYGLNFNTQLQKSIRVLKLKLILSRLLNRDSKILHLKNSVLREYLE